MFPVALLFLLGFTIWDCFLLKKKNKELQASIFQVDQNVWLGFLMFIGFAIVFDPAWSKSLSLFILAFVFPVYFSKRIYFFRKVDDDADFLIAASARKVVLYWLFGILAFSSVILAFIFFFGEFISELEEMVIAAVFSSVYLVCLIEHNVKYLRAENFWQAVGFSKEKKSLFLKIILPVALGLCMSFFSATIITGRDIQPSTPLNQALENNQSLWAIPLFVILALFVAPLVEEITFRGYFFEVLKKVKGQRVAFYVIALTFGALHMAQYWGDWAAITVIMIMGFWLTLVRIWANTTTASVIMHYFYNTGVVMFTAAIEISKGVS